MINQKTLKEFSPAWWCPGQHSQTIWRKLFGHSPKLSLRRERWKTPDGDFLDLDFLNPTYSENKEEKIPTILFLHGLEGSSRTKYILGMFHRSTLKGWRGIGLNFRSCSGEINKQKRFYHSGETSDLNWVIDQLIHRFPGSPLLIVGFSLGGNVLLKWLGEKGNGVPNQLQGAVAISVPFNLGTAAHRIDQGFNKIYRRNFLKTLIKKSLMKERLFPGLVDPKKVSRIVSFTEFDHEVTAPIHGFSDAQDYWKQCSSAQFLGSIQRPTLLISAMDDPFLPPSELPTKTVSQSKYLKACFPRYGGHVGFIQGITPWSVNYWAESRAFAFFSAFV